MYPDAYYKPCESVWYGNLELKEADHIFKPVSGFDGVDEKTLLKDNRAKYDYIDIFTYWVSFTSKNKMNTYMYYMYEKSYL